MAFPLDHSAGTKRHCRKCENLCQIQVCLIWSKRKQNSPSSKHTSGIKSYSITSLSLFLAGVELKFFPVAGVWLCFGFALNTGLIRCLCFC